MLNNIILSLFLISFITVLGHVIATLIRDKLRRKRLKKEALLRDAKEYEDRLWKLLRLAENDFNNGKESSEPLVQIYKDQLANLTKLRRLLKLN